MTANLKLLLSAAVVVSVAAAHAGAQTITALAVDDSSREMTKRVAPRPYNPGPRFPNGAWRRGEHGAVVAFMIVRPDGKPDMNTVYLVGTSEEFASSVRRALEATRFFPAERDGQKSAQLFQITYAFGFGSEPLDGDVTIHATRSR